MKKIKEQQLYEYLENMYEKELLQLIKEKDCQRVEFIRGQLAMLDILKADRAINGLEMLDCVF